MWITTKDGRHFNTDWIKDKRSLEDKYKHINPNYKENADVLDSEGYNNNCAKCAIAFEANMRGEDVEANPFEFGKQGERDKSAHNLERAFNQKDSWDIGRPKKEQTAKEIELMMKEDFGEGSRAIIQEFSKGSMHIMNVINDGGNVIIIDAQSGKSGSVSEMLKGINTKNMRLFRTDTQDISPEYSEWAYKNRKKGN